MAFDRQHVFLLFWLGSISAFSAAVRRQHPRRNPRSLATTRSRALTFDAEFAAQSDPVSVLTPERAMEYFRDPSCVVFGDSVPTTRQDEVPAPILKTWREACDKVGAKPPDPNHDFLLNVKTKGVSIPGLTVEWSATIGAVVVLDSKTHLPCYEFVLIQDDAIGTGIKPLLWIFDKIMKKRRDTKKGNVCQTHFFSRLGLKPTNDGEQHVFDSTGSIEIQCKVPSAVTRVLGKNQRKQEKRMSGLIGKQIQRDTEKAIRIWQQRYTDWIEESTRATTTRPSESSVSLTSERRPSYFGRVKRLCSSLAGYA